MTDLFGNGTLYREDRLTLTRLLSLADGVDLSQPVPPHRWTHLGNTIHYDTVVRVFVNYAPCIFFWRFELVFSDGGSKTVTTGSGQFARYWAAVQLIADEMLTVKDGITTYD